MIMRFDPSKTLGPRPPPPFHRGEGCPDLKVFVEDASHGGERAVVSLVFDEPRLGSAKLLRVDEDEATRLSEGLQDKRCQPRRCKDNGRRVHVIQSPALRRFWPILFPQLFRKCVLRHAGKQPLLVSQSAPTPPTSA